MRFLDRNRRSAARLCILPLMAFALAAGSCLAAASDPVFEKDIRPILKSQCFHCHGEESEAKGGLDVRLARFIIKGGESGPAIVPGHAAQSRLLELVKKGEMPKGKARLKDEQIAVLEKWIASGAKTARPEPEKLGPEHAFTDEDRAWWAFQPIQRPTPAKSLARSPGGQAGEIDSFIRERLAKEGLQPSPEADPVTLIRRASFDLTGLPPSPEEVEAFVKETEDEKTTDRGPEGAAGSGLLSSVLQSSVYLQLIERLLASPHYGERWGRHWLDVAGYADSDGYTDKDLERKWAWKYRDYVITALNNDKPFDQFIREQLAGDEMVPQPHTNLSPGAIEKITATGFLRMAPDGTGGMNLNAVQNACIADTIKIVSGSLLGLTVGCAQCHDHRYDPITHDDYYRLRAVFEPGFDTKSWRSPAGRLVSLLTDQERAESAKIEEEAKKLDAVRTARQEEFITEVLEKELLKADEKLREPLRAAYRTAAAKRTAEQTRLLKDWPRVNQLSAGSLYLYDTTYKTRHAKTLEGMAAEAAAVRARKPKEEFLHAFQELPKPAAAAIPATFVFNRGEPDQPKHQVQPGDLSVLAGQRKIEIAGKDPALPTTGRRLAFAKMLTDGRHPLLARVIVNRVWMGHFGRGIVASPADFGQLGQRPSHPELLDWLAAEFMRGGWSLKHLHRLIMSSQTYKQRSDGVMEKWSDAQPPSTPMLQHSSAPPLQLSNTPSLHSAAARQIDPDNLLLWRFPIRRLEAETLRDSLLAVTGKLNDKRGGPPVPVRFTEEGVVVLGIDTTDTAGRPTGKFVPLNGEEFRRSIYVQARRSMPFEMFAAFDAPAMTDAMCEVRPVTTVSPQSLLLMNNLYMREFAGHLAARLQRECGSDTAAQVRRAWQLAYSRPPSMADELAAVEFITAQAAHYRQHPSRLEAAAGPAPAADTPPQLLALAAFAHAILSANAFLYVD